MFKFLTRKPAPTATSVLTLTPAQREDIDREKLPANLRDALIVRKGLYIWTMAATDGKQYRVEFFDASPRVEVTEVA